MGCTKLTLSSLILFLISELSVSAEFPVKRMGLTGIFSSSVCVQL